MASVQVLQHVTDRGTPQGVAPTDTILIAGLANLAAGAATLFNDGVTTSVTVGRSTIGTKINGWLNVGSATAAVAVGDFATGSSAANTLSWDSSAATIQMLGSDGGANNGATITMGAQTNDPGSPLIIKARAQTGTGGDENTGGFLLLQSGTSTLEKSGNIHIGCPVAGSTAGKIYIGTADQADWQSGTLDFVAAATVD
ncbi:MAG TPA: hypothetical protein VMW94_06430, partial [Actinomycetes bacterium]|nr:hypothetical protein [Actinomycetes bacterium]